MTIARQRLGREAEELAAARLAAGGYRIVERNARIRTPELVGEIDLVALDRDALVFVEVKAGRKGARAGPKRPALAVGRRKAARLRRLGCAWLATAPRRPPHSLVRFDVVGVTLEHGGRVTAFEHIEAAF